MWKITERILSKFLGPPQPLYISRDGTKLVVSDDCTMVFIAVTDEYVGWIVFNFFVFKRKVNQGVTLKGIFAGSDKGFPTRYFQGVSFEEALANTQKYVSQLAGYVEPKKGELWPHQHEQK